MQEVLAFRAAPSIDSWQDCLVYAFLVALNARYVYGLSSETSMAARIFERVVQTAMANYVDGEAEHFGWPREGSPGERKLRGSTTDTST